MLLLRRVCEGGFRFLTMSGKKSLEIGVAERDMHPSIGMHVAFILG